jgi:hypothetical protein
MWKDIVREIKTDQDLNSTSIVCWCKRKWDWCVSDFCGSFIIAGFFSSLVAKYFTLKVDK